MHKITTEKITSVIGSFYNVGDEGIIYKSWLHREASPYRMGSPDPYQCYVEEFLVGCAEVLDE